MGILILGNLHIDAKLGARQEEGLLLEKQLEQTTNL